MLVRVWSSRAGGGQPKLRAHCTGCSRVPVCGATSMFYGAVVSFIPPGVALRLLAVNLQGKSNDALW